jgi:hypothetical protein
MYKIFYCHAQPVHLIGGRRVPLPLLSGSKAEALEASLVMSNEFEYLDPCAVPRFQKIYFARMHEII